MTARRQWVAAAPGQDVLRLLRKCLLLLLSRLALVRRRSGRPRRRRRLALLAGLLRRLR